MKKHDKNLPPEGHQPPHEKPHKHEKHHHHRRGPSAGLVILILLVLGVAAFYVLWQNGFFHFGKGSGDGEGSGTAVVSNVTEGSQPGGESSKQESAVVEVKVDNDKIYLDGEQFASAEELKNKITEIGDKKTYNFVHDTAIKATYDEVKAVLSDLERALSIKVNYNDER